MNPNVPYYIDALVILVVAIIIAFVFYSLKYALSSQNISIIRKRKYYIVTAAVSAGWLITSSLIAFYGTLTDFVSTPPKLMLVVIPPVLAISYLSSSTRVNALIQEIPSSWLVYIQSFRILVELFLWMLFAKSIIPVQMTFEGLNYDILIGLSAPLVAYYALSQNKWPRIVAVLWNFAGLLLVTNIFLVAFLSTPGPMRQFFNEPPNTIVAYFPFVWLPAFIVPFAYLMHILSLKQIVKFNK
ncbi:MAG TPA: hypothetical protein VG961_05505 [Ignavibacteria bacterium]|nr:hypothetical protein [Ignavibacteria bacterium]